MADNSKRSNGHLSVHCHHKKRQIDRKKLPYGGWLLTQIGCFNFKPYFSYRLYILVLTFVCYTCYHMSRKPFSVVASVLAPSCKHYPNTTCGEEERSISLDVRASVDPYNYIEGWPPFNTSHCKSIIGGMNYSWLFTYAIFMLISGIIADRVNVRYFLTVGMIGSGIFVGLLGVAYYANIHYLAYFIIVQLGIGVFQSTGWPASLAVMGNWFGKKNRGLLMGVWNSHTSVGNILGTIIPAVWAVPGQPWAWSFLVPAFIMIFMAVIIFLFLIVDPVHVGLPPSQHHLDSNDIQNIEQQQLEGKKEEETFELTERNKEDMSSDNEGLTDIELSEDIGLINDEESLNSKKSKKEAIDLLGALQIPGVIEFAISLFFSKLVAYTFLLWLPYYLAFHPISGECTSYREADLLATLFDIGGIVGGIFTGGLSDLINARAISCVIMMYCAVPTMFMYRYTGHVSLTSTIILILLCGLFINGPYALITTAVANDLGTHESLKENQRAKATVGAIIDGMGSLGAAFGPLVTGFVSDYFGWDSAFYVLMMVSFLSSLMLSRLLYKEVVYFYKNGKKWFQKRRYHRHSFNSIKTYN